jgi:phage tail protein X
MARPLLPSPGRAAFDAHLLARTSAIDALELPPLPSLGDFPPPFPPKIPIPLPDCSAFEHTGSAPEPPEDSEP